MNSSRKRKTFPKEGEKKLKDTIQKLKARNRYLEKKIKFYEDRASDQATIINSAMRGGKIAKTKVTPETKEDARKRILAQFRESLKERKK